MMPAGLTMSEFEHSHARLSELPMEFAVEAQNLFAASPEGSVG